MLPVISQRRPLQRATVKPSTLPFERELPEIVDLKKVTGSWQEWNRAFLLYMTISATIW